MAKKLANKGTKELVDEAMIREKKMNKGEFTPSWQGRIAILNPEKSMIAGKIGYDKRGEYAIKCR